MNRVQSRNLTSLLEVRAHAYSARERFQARRGSGRGVCNGRRRGEVTAASSQRQEHQRAASISGAAQVGNGRILGFGHR